eukprot:Gregarina_sp_Poly_1__2090@NODE_154_length_12409_cov_137_944904_g136_i0_p4_GENE_NODE_154_length_12409_cov_137_944904_g136_i0NODE_154_length_12409_cov_137_944904_g136_i0_p4_ORF_typecomplete_len373_score37_71Rad51/PF08423_11/8_6e10ATPase/PF06745_13/2_9e03ATPase/PF06745_13/0_0093ATPase/PF06745_13/1_6e02Pox_A32/PF04665_12/0_01RecA/PF00154_21/0_071_NODE_154_length_12409_cov_137_944904_g136_i085469664
MNAIPIFCAATPHKSVMFSAESLNFECQKLTDLILEHCEPSELDKLFRALLDCPTRSIDVLVDFYLPVCREWLVLLEKWASLTALIRSPLASVLDDSRSKPRTQEKTADHVVADLATLLMWPGQLTDVCGECSAGKTQLLLTVLVELLSSSLNFNLYVISIYHPLNVKHLKHMLLGKALNSQNLEGLRIASSCENIDDLIDIMRNISKTARYDYQNCLLIDDISLSNITTKKKLLELYEVIRTSLLKNNFAVLQTSGCTSRGLAWSDIEFEDVPNIGFIVPPTKTYSIGKPWADSLIRHSFVDNLCVLQTPKDELQETDPFFCNLQRELDILKHSRGMSLSTHCIPILIHAQGLRYDFSGSSANSSSTSFHF